MSNSGELHTFPVSAGLLDPRHVQAIDPSSPWPIYLWFLEHVTRDEEREDDFVGIVLHGRSISIRQIAQELGIKERPCRRHLARLVKAGYVLQKQTGGGACTYEVAKSKKWAWRRRTRASRNQPSKAPESQASLSFPTNSESGDSPHQKVVRGPSSPHQILVGSDQKVVSLIRKDHSSHKNLSQGDVDPTIEDLRPSEESQSPPSENRPPPIEAKTSTQITVGAIGTEKLPPAGLTAHQLARGMMDNLGVPGGRSDLEIWSRAIELKARKAEMSKEAAYQYIYAKARTAQDRGEFTKPTFWMKDMCYDHEPKRSKSDVFERSGNAAKILTRWNAGPGTASA
jgi:Winged helix-turn-helix DNA-binding